LNPSHVHNKWPIAKEGIPFILISCGLTFLSLYFPLLPVSVFLAVLSLFIIYFFRDPHRENEADRKAVLTPADGKVVEIRRLTQRDSPSGEPAVRISIFMSLFDVHVNRIPVGGTIQQVTYHPGKFFSANLDKASKYNESNRITLQTLDACKIVFIQIAGLIARRISCWIKEGDEVVSGQRFGLIRFGSRLEVCLPVESRVAVTLNQKVKAGETVIGILP